MATHKIRRKEKSITEISEIKNILRITQYITLAMAKDNIPYLCSLSHYYDEIKNIIYFHCANEGKKIEYLNSNNIIWGQTLIDNGYVQQECTHDYISVQFKGKVIFVQDKEEKRNALLNMIYKLDSNPEKVITKELTEEAINKVTIGKIEIQHLSGKKSIQNIP